MKVSIFTASTLVLLSCIDPSWTAQAFIIPNPCPSFNKKSTNRQTPTLGISQPPTTATQETNQDDDSTSRRSLIEKSTAAATAILSAGAIFPSSPAAAANSKSRTDGYAVQRSEREWAYILSGAQYNILRQGGTERPYSSILEGEDRPGTFVCAGCGTPLFESAAKFHSGTGWPSFATALPGVEIEDVNPVQASLAGAELRCGTCGGHLGDVFNDGKLFVNTPAFQSGKRFCIDGVALIFKPSESGSEDVYGDMPPPKKQNDLPSFLQPPKINPVS